MYSRPIYLLLYIDWVNILDLHTNGTALRKSPFINTGLAYKGSNTNRVDKTTPHSNNVSMTGLQYGKKIVIAYSHFTSLNTTQ